MKNLKINKLDLNGLTPATKQVIFDLVYPVGSYIYIDNPDFDTVAKVEAYYGGHWEKITDRVLYGVSSGAGTDTGNNNPTVPVPKHNHTFSGNRITGSVGGDHAESYHFRGNKVENGALSLDQWSNTGYAGNTNGASGHTAAYIKFDATPSGSISDTGTDGATIDVRGARRTTYIYHRIAPVQNS